MLDVKFEINWVYKGKKGKETLFHTAIGNFVTAMRDWAPAFRSMVTEVLEPMVEEQFDTAGKGTWAELSPSTVRAKGHDTILFNSGRLYRSFKTGPDHVEIITRDKLTWGSRLMYALFHQTGTGRGFQNPSPFTMRGGRGMPMRKILQLSPDDKKKMRSILVQRLATIARKEGYAVRKGMTTDPLTARKIGQTLLGI